MASHSVRVIYSNLPLAVYLELAAHIRQVQGVKTTLLENPHQDFNYLASQVGGLEISYPSMASHQEKTQVEKILNHYRQIHGDYELSDRLPR